MSIQDRVRDVVERCLWSERVREGVKGGLYRDRVRDVVENAYTGTE